MKDYLPVILNVYKIAENTIIDKLGVELYHTAIEYDNNEFAFGYMDDPSSSGIYDIKPMSFDDGTYVESLNLGKVKRKDFFVKLEKIKRKYLAKSYNILTKNCNHFTNDFTKTLLNKEIPPKYASFLKLGEFIRNLTNFSDF